MFLARKGKLHRPGDTILADLGYCLYCGAKAYLTKEHVVPYSLGGNVVLKRASCPACQAITTGFELSVARETYRTMRALSAYPSRQPQGYPTHVPVSFVYPEGSRKEVMVPIREVPIVIVMPRFRLPPFCESPVEGFKTVAEDGSYMPVLHAAHLDDEPTLQRRWASIHTRWAPGSRTRHVNSGAFSVDDWARMIRKIAVGFAAQACPEVLAAGDLPSRVIASSVPGAACEGLYSQPATPLQHDYFRARVFAHEGRTGRAVYCGVTLFAGDSETEHLCEIGPPRGSFEPVVFTPRGQAR